MRAPSVKALRSAFNLSSRDANLIRRIARAAGSGAELERVIEMRGPEATRIYVRSLHSDPYGSQIWRVTVALHAINEIVGGYGVEGLGPGRSGDYAPPYEYVNQGDPYRTTLVYTRATDTLSIRDWGSIAERHPSWE
jgi:hypothetical protein